MNIPPRNLPGGYMHLDFSPLHPWGDDTFVQWGKSSYSGFFVEAYPPGTYLTGHGATLAEAEDRAWNQHQREIACPEHRWSPLRDQVDALLREHRGPMLPCGHPVALLAFDSVDGAIYRCPGCARDKAEIQAQAGRQP